MERLLTASELQMVIESEGFQLIKESKCDGIEQECAWDRAVQSLINYITEEVKEPVEA